MEKMKNAEEYLKPVMEIVLMTDKAIVLTSCSDDEGCSEYSPDLCFFGDECDGDECLSDCGNTDECDGMDEDCCDECDGMNGCSCDGD